MDITERKITKIAREAEKLVLCTLREQGVGTAEIDLIHALRHHPGCTQAALAELSCPRRCPQRPAQPAFVPDREGREPEILEGRDRGGLLWVSDRRAARRRGRCLCGNAG